MKIEDFKANWQWVHRMTVDFVEIVPSDKWEFTPARARRLRHSAELADGLEDVSYRLRLWRPRRDSRPSNTPEAQD